jgi:integrase
MAVIGFDPLRNDAWLAARSACEVADWIAALKARRLAPRTVRQYAYTVWDLVEMFPGKAPDEFTPADIDQLLAKYPVAGLGPRRAHVESFFRHLSRREVILRNPMDRMEPMRRKKVRLPHIYSDAQVNALCGLPSPDGQLMTIRFELGLRSGECRKLKRKHVNLDAGLVSILRAKGDKDRLVPMTLRAQRAVARLDLEEGIGLDDHLWYTKPGGGTRLQHRFLTESGPAEETFRSWWKRCCAQAEVPYMRPHTSRHTRATVMRRKGYDLAEIQDFLGHESSETTKALYVHTDVFDLARRMEELEGAHSE